MYSCKPALNKLRPRPVTVPSKRSLLRWDYLEGGQNRFGKILHFEITFTVTCAPYKEIHVTQQNSNNLPNYFDAPSK